MNGPDVEGMAPAVYQVIRRRYPFAPEVLRPEMGFGVDLAGDSLTFIELGGDIEVELGSGFRMRKLPPCERSVNWWTW